MKRMKLITALLAAFLIFQVLPAMAQQTISDKQSIKFPDPANQGRVIIRWNNGDINVRGYSGTDVNVEILNRDRESRDERSRSRGLRRVAGGSTIEYEIDGKDIIITGYSSMKEINVEIEVPTNVDLTIENKQYGGIEIEDYSGEIEVSTMYDKIILNNVTGPVVAFSTYGEIFAVLENVTTDNPMSFKTMYSSLDLTLPADIKASIDMRTSDAIYSDFEFQKRTVRERSNRTRSNEFDINGGGVEIEIKTTYGNIYLRKGK